MKGVVLAGGTGSRLFPLTKITNKHLLPIYDRPMIYYPIQTLVDAGIRDILIVTGGRNSGDFLRLLANGKEFGLKHINYTYQEGEGGIADALALAEHFADGQKICVILGDNIIEGGIREAAEQFPAQPHGAHILLKEVPDAERFGVAELAGDKIAGIEEKPAHPNPTTPSPASICTTRRCSTRSRRWFPRSAANWKSPTSTTPTSGKAHDVFVPAMAGGRTPARSIRCCARPIWWRSRWNRQAEGGRCWSDGGNGGNERGAAPALPSSGLELAIPVCPKGIGALIGAPDSRDLIDGVRVQPFPVYPGRPRLFSGSAAHRAGAGGGLSRRRARRFPRP